MKTSKSTSANSNGHFKLCSIKLLPKEKWIKAAQSAVGINPNNAIATTQLKKAFPDIIFPAEHLALLIPKRWPNGGVSLTVGFLGDTDPQLRTRILSHMNSWSTYCNVSFVESDSNAQVRISFTSGDGYWSYLGTDILQIDQGEPTMNLDDFSMDTSESEFHRVVRHETGHTLGFPHEHMRSEIVDEIDREKAISYFESTQGWSEQEVINQVLTPIDSSALIATEHADVNSIMCYWLPAEIMKNEIAVPGGTDIDSQDAKFAATIYPKTVQS